MNERMNGWAHEQVVRARGLPFNDRLEAAQQLKRQGDKLLREGGQPLEATLQYEYALAVFRHLENKDPGWKKKGILDEDIIEREYVPQPCERSALEALYTACYLNLARAYFKQGDVSTALAACRCTLDVDAANDKALLLRAQV